MNDKQLNSERHTLQEIASGVYTRWRIKSPSKVQKLLDYIDGKSTANLNDTKMTLRTQNTIVEASTVKDNFNIHSIESIRTGETVSVGESANMEKNSRPEFKSKVYEIWSSHAEQL